MKYCKISCDQINYSKLSTSVHVYYDTVSSFINNIQHYSLFKGINVLVTAAFSIDRNVFRSALTRNVNFAALRPCFTSSIH